MKRSGLPDPRHDALAAVDCPFYHANTEMNVERALPSSYWQGPEELQNTANQIHRENADSTPSEERPGT